MRRMTAALLVVLVTVLAGSWFFSSYERITYKEYVGWRGEARFNHFLAAEMLLREFDVDAESQASLKPSHWLPDSTDTLVMTLSQSLTIGAEADLLQEWVQSGGHLVLMPPGDVTNDVEAFLERLGFAVFEPEHPEDDNDDDAEETGYEIAESLHDDVHDYEVYLRSTWFRIRDVDGSDELGSVSDDYGLIVARRLVGDGIVTMLATDVYFMNWYLNKADHGRLMLDIIDGYYDPGKVWFVYGADFAPLWAVIWQNAPALVLTLLALFALWLWRIVPRFGPRTRYEVVARRSIGEHMAAAGRFMWKKRGADHMHQASVRALMHAAERSAVGIGRKSSQEQAAIIAHMTGLDADEVLAAIHANVASGHREFMHQIQTLQRLRKNL